MNFATIIRTVNCANGFRLFVVAVFFLFGCNTALAQSNIIVVNNGDMTPPVIFSDGGCVYSWSNNNPQIGLAGKGSGNIAPFTAINTGTKPIYATIIATPVSDGFAYVANTGTDDVSVINTATNAVVDTIPVGNQPWSVSVSPDGRKVYVLNANNTNGHAPNGSVSVIDAVTNTVTATIPVGSNPTSIVVSPDGKTAYVTNEKNNNVSEIDIVNNVPSSNIQIVYAKGMAISSDGTRLYVSADSNTAKGTLYVINTADGQVIQTVPVGLTPTGVAVSPDGSKVYVTDYNGNTISVIDAVTYAVKTVTVGLSPFALAVSPMGDKIYVSNTGSKSVSIINTADYSVINLPMLSNPQGISISPNGKEVYVAGQNPDGIEVINTQTNEVQPIASAGVSPISIGNFVTAGIGCSTLPITYTIKVNPPPNIDNPGSVSAWSTHYGVPSSTQTISVSGNSLRAGITVTAPPGFEVSTDSVTFSPMLTIGAAGDIAPTKVFVRLKGYADAGSYGGYIQLDSPGAITVTTPAEGTVLAAPLSIAADDKTKFLGDPNPMLTVTYKGFVNGDSAAQLDVSPLITTTATINSPIGKYPITAAGASAKNYTITYLAGVLEVLTGDISVPNAFTPNGDGINDTWDIKNLSLYTTCTIEVLNRYGQKIFYANGYAKPWNGTIGGGNLPVGTYYYIIKLNPGARPITGYLNIIR